MRTNPLSSKNVPKLMKALADLFTEDEMALMNKAKLAAMGKELLTEAELASLKALGTKV